MQKIIKHLRLFFTIFLISIFLSILVSCKNETLSRPNILWITCEDISPMLGCYGDVIAKTPNIDSFAQKSVKFTNAFSTASVCAPSRSTLVTGVYASSLGTQHLRSEITIPKSIVPFPKLLKEVGYYVTNNYKEDYNFTDTTIWNNSSNGAHWRGRKGNQPFFSVFNILTTHQSKIFGNDSVYYNRISDYSDKIEPVSPDNLKLPPYYPNSPVIRKLWARYYMNISIMDYQFEQIMQDLKMDGLLENTIVFFFSDHGIGMPRSKRALYDSGLKVPLLVYAPEKYAGKFNLKANTENSAMVSFVDFAPTLLKLAGVTIPDKMQGHSFISSDDHQEKDYVFGITGRVDEAYDMSRTIRTSKYRYIRNFKPFLPLLQPNYYTDQSEIMQEMEIFRNSPKLTPQQAKLFNPERLPEELYDIENDPHEMDNLAKKPEYQKILISLREKMKLEIMETFDTGLMPEPEMHRLSLQSTPYEIARDSQIFPVEKILSACDLILEEEPDIQKISENLSHSSGFVRYWAVITVQSLNLSDPSILTELKLLYNDDFITTRIEAAKTLIKAGNYEAIQSILKYLNSEDDIVSLYAARAFQEIWQLLPNVPQEFFMFYEKLRLKNETENNLNYYELYTYWALSEVNKKIN